MTAIMRYAYNKEYPVILGDLLLSGLPTEKEVHIPTIDNVVNIFPKETNHVPVGMQQKIVLISKNLVIGWSGNYLTAKDFIQDLYFRNQEEPFTKKSIDLYFRSCYENLLARGVGIIGFIKDEKGIAKVGFGYQPSMTKAHGEIAYIGSGGRSLDKLLFRISQGPVADYSDPNIADYAISYSLSLTGLLILDEISTNIPIKQLFGGGYEIAFYSHECFQKLDNISYLYWSVECDDTGISISKPLLFICLSYIDDILLFRRIQFNHSNSQSSIKQSVYAITPMYRVVPKDELDRIELPKLNMNWLCSYFVVNHSSKDPEVYVRIDYRKEIDRCIRFIEEDNQVIIEVEDKFIKDVALDIQKHYE